ncbi:5'/3'-nucleotidase SurE [Maribacter sp. 2307ULW6-5]|uniref:5'/3'-nucleotidase SurE n=1 Tax=Maribacter sp. 2307ULW6-5 TaxID=3386275 RepID=UPI0039BC500D
MSKPLILVTNDDGITAPGLRTLVSLMNQLGEVYVVAPDSPQSGMGHAITLDSTLYSKRMRQDMAHPNVVEYSCSGTPADCVKLALKEILPRRPDLCVSGINHGANHSINVLYSGTMSAAVEAGIEGVPAIGFSLCDYNWNANFEPGSDLVKTIVEQALEHPMPKDVVLNVNIPDLPKEALKGIKVCRQARANWNEKFDKRTNPNGKDYYWLTGRFELLDEGQDTDVWALEQGYVSVVPTQFDLTAHHAIRELNQWDFGP